LTASGLAKRSSRSDHHAGGPAQTAAVYYDALRHAGRLDLYGLITSTVRAAAGSSIAPQGEKPADLPVQTPDQVRTRHQSQDRAALGLDVPATLLVRVDEVID